MENQKQCDSGHDINPASVITGFIVLDGDGIKLQDSSKLSVM